MRHNVSMETRSRPEHPLCHDRSMSGAWRADGGQRQPPEGQAPGPIDGAAGHALLVAHGSLVLWGLAAHSTYEALPGCASPWSFGSGGCARPLRLAAGARGLVLLRGRPKPLHLQAVLG